MPHCYYYHYYFVANRNSLLLLLLLLLLILTYYYRWVTFIVGLICFVLLQVIWCCRQSKIGLYISAGISTVAAITCTIAGIVMLVVWKDQVNCSVWRLTGGGYWLWVSDDYWGDDSDYDYCEEGKWAVVAFVSALLWFTTSGCILYFVKSGRHTKWEHKLQAAAAADADTTDTTTAIEMGTVQQYHHDDNHHQQQSPIALATTSATTTAVATAVVLPDIPNKIDNV